ncbi:hypothetical protein [Methylobacterium soli]|uniref:Uncharacterized protein n=1 Tax=Methylobacterium soli TaxID=553447 RepID=A0A6L3SRL1_9HYPH|nr:hypothetical protein [Methylobacterium soli]KAB1075404.1 hypothetical protein F6X53_24865 [Methylobacterium soli]
MPHRLFALVCTIVFVPPIGMLLLIVWPVTRIGGTLFAVELYLIALAMLTAGLSIILANAATDPRTRRR